jgi:HD superfamily phosphohydrolase
MSRPKFFRDPVHVQLRFENVALDKAPPKDAVGRRSWVIRKLIDDPVFQRLRHIRQNGLANFVFHGAEHSRFTHSLGVCHLAGINYEFVKRNCSERVEEDEHLQVMAAALLHDIGHGPFSHTLEEVLNEIDVEFHHEAMTLKFISSEDSTIHQTLVSLDPSLPEALLPFFDKKRRREPHWKFKIVSSQLDADRLDYLMRDSLYCGIKGHGFDLARIQDLMYHHENKIAVDIGALEAVEAYLVTLDHLYRAIYYHHAVRAATVMLTQAFSRASKLYRAGDRSIVPDFGGGNLVRDLFEKGINIEVGKYGRLGEFHFWQCLDIWRESKDFVLSNLSSRILGRSLFKAIELREASHRKYAELTARAKELAQQMYPDLDQETVDNFVIHDGPERTSYKAYTWKPEESAEDSIWLIGDGEPCPIEESQQSPIIEGLKRSRYFERLIMPDDVKLALMEAMK